MLAQPGFDLWQIAGVEYGGYLCAFFAVADHGIIGAVAQRQSQGIDKDRLACPGLTGQCGHAAREIH